MPHSEVKTCIEAHAFSRAGGKEPIGQWPSTQARVVIIEIVDKIIGFGTQSDTIALNTQHSIGVIGNLQEPCNS